MKTNKNRLNEFNFIYISKFIHVQLKFMYNCIEYTNNIKYYIRQNFIINFSYLF